VSLFSGTSRQRFDSKVSAFTQSKGKTKEQTSSLKAWCDANLWPALDEWHWSDAKTTHATTVTLQLKERLANGSHTDDSTETWTKHSLNDAKAHSGLKAGNRAIGDAMGSLKSWVAKNRPKTNALFKALPGLGSSPFWVRECREAYEADMEAVKRKGTSNYMRGAATTATAALKVLGKAPLGGQDAV
jgi:hypothetical protein